MITKNYDSISKSLLFGKVYPAGKTSDSELTDADYLDVSNAVMRDINGIYQAYGTPQFSSTGSYTFVRAVVLGTQATENETFEPESYFDYKLLHPGLSYTPTVNNYKDHIKKKTENGIDYWNITYTYSNNTSENMLVREIGIYVRVNGDEYNGANTSVLIYRKLLPTYVTVEPNGTYTIDLNIPITNINPNKPN